MRAYAVRASSSSSSSSESSAPAAGPPSSAPNLPPAPQRAVGDLRLAQGRPPAGAQLAPVVRPSTSPQIHRRQLPPERARQRPPRESEPEQTRRARWHVGMPRLQQAPQLLPFRVPGRWLARPRAEGRGCRCQQRAVQPLPPASRDAAPCGHAPRSQSRRTARCASCSGPQAPPWRAEGRAVARRMARAARPCPQDREDAALAITTPEGGGKRCCGGPEA